MSVFILRFSAVFGMNGFDGWNWKQNVLACHVHYDSAQCFAMQVVFYYSTPGSKQCLRNVIAMSSEILSRFSRSEIV